VLKPKLEAKIDKQLKQAVAKIGYKTGSKEAIYENDK
jgi:hypothetical protein